MSGFTKHEVAILVGGMFFVIAIYYTVQRLAHDHHDHDDTVTETGAINPGQAIKTKK